MWPTIRMNRWSASPFDELRRQMDRVLDDFNVGLARPGPLSRAVCPPHNRGVGRGRHVVRRG